MRAIFATRVQVSRSQLTIDRCLTTSGACSLVGSEDRPRGARSNDKIRRLGPPGTPHPRAALSASPSAPLYGSAKLLHSRACPATERSDGRRDQLADHAAVSVLHIGL